MMNLPLGEENATYEKELKKCWDEGFAEGRADIARLESINRDLMAALESINYLSRQYAKSIEHLTAHTSAKANVSATEKDDEAP